MMEENPGRNVYVTYTYIHRRAFRESSGEEISFRALNLHFFLPFPLFSLLAKRFISLVLVGAREGTTSRALA